MPTICRLSDEPYRWDIVEAPLSEVANREKMLPPDFIGADALWYCQGGSSLFGAAHCWGSLSAIQEQATRL